MKMRECHTWRQPRPSQIKKRVFAQRRKARFFVQAALALGILFGVVLSAVFVTGAGESRNHLASADDAMQRFDASGQDGILDAAIIDPRLILGTELPVIYGVDIEEVYLHERVEADETPESDIYFDVLPDDIKLEILGFQKDAPKSFFVDARGGPQILIYHTHTQEAYRQTPGLEYVETGSWRTAQEDRSVVAVGDALKKELEGYGYTVLHDKTNHEPPQLNTAYTRSLDTMEQYKKQYPSLRVFIDVHRDAYGDVAAGSKDFVKVEGNECARIMFVVGTGEKYSQKPNYESNYKLALAVTNQLESIKKGFTRPIRVKTGRYNQQVSDMCLLIEVGHNANSFDQAINSIRYVSLALSRVLEPS